MLFQTNHVIWCCLPKLRVGEGVGEQGSTMFSSPRLGNPNEGQLRLNRGDVLNCFVCLLDFVVVICNNMDVFTSCC